MRILLTAPRSPSLTCECSFKPDLTKAGVVDWQKIRLQEQAVDDAKDEGRVPRTIECELTEVRTATRLRSATHDTSAGPRGYLRSR